MKIPLISKWLEKRSQQSLWNKIINSFRSGSTTSGVSVTPDSAMRTSAVWACVRVLSFSLASLPLHVYRISGEGSQKATDNPVYQILHRSPNPEQTSWVFRQGAMAHICLHGNAYAEIEFDNFGNPIALWPIPPWCCEPMRSENGELYYRINVPYGSLPNHPKVQTYDLQPYRILHIRGLGTDGMKGLSPIRQHMETIGISIAAEQFGGAFFGNGMNVGGVVSHPGTLTKQGSNNLRNSLNEEYAGLGNASRIILLEEGMKYEKVGIPPEEAQFLETRQFQVEDIARIYGVQLHKIGHLLHSTFSNIEQQNIEFVTDTMLPWVTNWEQEYDRRLLKPGYYTKHSLEGLLRGDSASRAAFYKELFYMGALSPDEIREKEEMNPQPDGIGDRYYVQSNMTPADKIDEFLFRTNTNKVTMRSTLPDAVKKITERDKANIKRAFQKDPATFEKWLEDYKEDFQDFMIKEIGGQ